MAQTFENGEGYGSIRAKLNANAEEINDKLNYTEAVIRVTRDSLTGDFFVNVINNGFTGVDFTASNPTGTNIAITASAPVFTAGKTVFTAMPFSSGSNYWVALSLGDLTTTERRLRLRKYDQSETTLGGFGELVITIRVYD